MKKYVVIVIGILLSVVGVILFFEGSDTGIAENPSYFGESYNFDIAASTFTGNYSEEELGDYQITFKGYLEKVKDFSSICVGKGKGGPLGYYLYVDTDLIEVRRNVDNKLIERAYHKIGCIEDYVHLNIVAGMDAQAKIELMTKGGYFSTNLEWVSNYQNLFVSADEFTKLKNCTLTYHCDGWDKDIWLFGDSYFSLSQPDRWTTYLIDNGADNILLNGRSGRGSADALVSLKYCLNYGKPEMLIWCMGMNDGDNGTINESYYSVLQEVMGICKQKDIELILATIPTCPYWNNDYKNDFVKNSGYRYIDFAKAVGAYESITWYDGMLEETEPRIHPTESGAIALYNEAIATVPELLEKE